MHINSIIYVHKIFLRFNLATADQASSQIVPYYAKVQLEKSLRSSNAESTGSIHSVEEVTYENIPPANRNSNIVSSVHVNIAMADNPAYGTD